MKKIVFSLLAMLLSFNVVEAKSAYDQCYEPCKDTCESAYQTAMNNGDYSGMGACTQQCATRCADKNRGETSSTDNVDAPLTTYSKVYCGGLNIPTKIAKLVNTGINIIKIVVPILIIFVGSFDFVKAVIAQKDDEIKKGQQMFFKRLISGVLVFLVIFIVQIVIGIVAPEEKNNGMWDCVDCLINGDC